MIKCVHIHPCLIKVEACLSDLLPTRIKYLDQYEIYKQSRLSRKTNDKWCAQEFDRGVWASIRGEGVGCLSFIKEVMAFWCQLSKFKKEISYSRKFFFSSLVYFKPLKQITV